MPPRMIDAARIEAVIEVITQCEESWQKTAPTPADILIHHYFRDRRFIGSKDRAYIAELAYFIIRQRASLLWWSERYGQGGPRALCFAALMFQKKMSLSELQTHCSGERFCPEKLTPPEEQFARKLAGLSLAHPDMPAHVRCNVQEWMIPLLQTSLGEQWEEALSALGQEASVDLRTNTLLTTRESLLEALKGEGVAAEPTPLSPIGIRLTARTPIFATKAFKDGWFEMQDEGSQLVSLLLDVQPGQRVIDFCAGAGGKTLALAARMKNKGRILAWDTSERRLNQMPERLKRAHVDNVQRTHITSEVDPFIKRHKDTADAVLVDAPCSGTGTWRRNPDLKWRFSEKDLQEVVELQQNILRSASRLVKVKGHLLYVTCSLLQNENESQIEAFLSEAKKFRVVSEKKVWNNSPQPTIKQDGMYRFTPHEDGTDGFFAAMLQRIE